MRATNVMRTAKWFILLFIVIGGAAIYSIPSSGKEPKSTEKAINLYDAAEDFAIANSTNIDALLADLFINGQTKGDDLLGINGSEMNLFYEAQHHYENFVLGDEAAFKEALASVDRAIKKDGDNALNHFFKAFLLSQEGKIVDADGAFAAALAKPHFHTYQERGTVALVKLLKRRRAVSEANAIALFRVSQKLMLNENFMKFLNEKFHDKVEGGSAEEQRRIAGFLCDLLAEGQNAFDFVRITNYYLGTITMASMPDTAKSNQCDPDISLKPLDEIVLIAQALDKFEMTGNTKDIRKTNYWNTIQTIAKESP